MVQKFGHWLGVFRFNAGVAGVILFGLILTVAGPFGTYNALRLPERLVYWLPLVLLVALLILALGRLQKLSVMRTISLPSRLVTGCAFVLGFAPLVFAYNQLWGRFLSTNPVDFGTTFVMVVFATLGVTMFDLLVRNSNTVPAPDTESDPAPRLIRRLETSTDAQIARLTVNDHYVEVYFVDGGRERILMRFADAVAEMEGARGVATHRSHWVSEAAMDTLIREGSRDILVLTCGTRIPVSRRYRADVAGALACKAAAL